jgi:hypothetical protein
VLAHIPELHDVCLNSIIGCLANRICNPWPSLPDISEDLVTVLMYECLTSIICEVLAFRGLKVFNLLVEEVIEIEKTLPSPQLNAIKKDGGIKSRITVVFKIHR